MTGCIHPQGSCEIARPELLGVARSTVTAHIGPVPAGWPTEEGWAGPYRSLALRECQCRAAWSTPMAELLDAERDRRKGRFRLCGRHGTDLEGAVLGHAAKDLRNRNAGDALEAYLRLIEAEGRADLMDQSLAEVRKQIAQVEEMSGKGIRPPVDAETLRRQLLLLRADAARLQLAIAQLNQQLRQLLGIDHDGKEEEYRIWPAYALHATFEAIDAESAVAVGLKHRSDLNLLRDLSASLAIHSLGVARKVLSGLNPLLAPSSCACLADLLVLLAPHQAVAVVRGQIDRLLADRESTAAGEIRLAVRQVETRARLVALAHQGVQSLQRRLAELEEQQAKGVAAPGLQTARLDLLRGRGELLTELAQWAIAGVQLKRAQGLLACEFVEDDLPDDAENETDEP